jgi:hypothetical protein
VISLIFGEYLCRLFFHSNRADVSPDDIPQWAIKLTAIGAISTVTILCVATRELGTRIAMVFTTLKVKYSPHIRDAFLLIILQIGALVSFFVPGRIGVAK